MGAAVTAVELSDGAGLSVQAYGGQALNTVVTAYVIAGLASMRIDSGWEIAPTSPEIGLAALAGDEQLGLLLRGGFVPGLAPRPPPGLVGAPERVAIRRPPDRAPATPAVTWLRVSAATPMRWGAWSAQAEAGLDWPVVVGAELPSEQPRLRGAAALGRLVGLGLHLGIEWAADSEDAGVADHGVAATLGQQGDTWAWSLSAGPGAAHIGVRRSL